MNIAVLLVLGAIFGFGGHQLRPILKRDFLGGWFSISCYAVGFLIASPFLVALYLALGGKRDEVGHILAGYFLSGMGIGGGVVTGHYLQPDKD